MIAVVLLSICVIGLAMVAMAVGALFSRPCLRGSCGGLGPGSGNEAFDCAACPLRRPPATRGDRQGVL